MEFKTHSVVNIRNRKRDVRKLIKKNQNEIVTISHNCKEEYVFENRIKSYNQLSIEIVLPVIERICREAAAKYNLKLPLEDIFLYATPNTAYKFIEKLIGVSRIFTIVSEEPLNELADELYFEKGCLIRRVQKAESKAGGDTISIFVEKSGFVFSPVINIMKDAVAGEKVINVREIEVSEKEMNEINKSIGGINGLVLYNLLGRIPGENAWVNINKTADTIFLLDTKAI